MEAFVGDSGASGGILVGVEVVDWLEMSETGVSGVWATSGGTTVS
jgi:hypothetical protein